MADLDIYSNFSVYSPLYVNGDVNLHAGTISSSGEWTIVDDLNIDYPTYCAELKDSIFNVGGKFNAEGNSESELVLLNATDEWFLNVSVTGTAQFVSVTQSNALGGSVIDASDGTNIDGGFTRNWLFPLSSADQGFQWNVGKKVWYYYQVDLECIDVGSIPAGLNLSIDCNKPLMWSQAVAAPDLAGVCEAMSNVFKNYEFQWPVKSIRRMLQPIFTNDISLIPSTISIDPSCVAIEACAGSGGASNSPPPAEFCYIPECLSFCADEVGMLTISEPISTTPILTVNILEPMTGKIDSVCGCDPRPILGIYHELYRSKIFKDLLLRTGKELDSVLNLVYQGSGVWKYAVYLGGAESLNVSFIWKCLDEDGQNWKYTISVTKKVSGKRLETKITCDISQNIACYNSKVDFEFAINVKTGYISGASGVRCIIQDQLGLFADPGWDQNPDFRLRIAPMAKEPSPTQDISSLFP